MSSNVNPARRCDQALRVSEGVPKTLRFPNKVSRKRTLLARQEPWVSSEYAWPTLADWRGDDSAFNASFSSDREATVRTLAIPRQRLNENA